MFAILLSASLMVTSCEKAPKPSESVTTTPVSKTAEPEPSTEPKPSVATAEPSMPSPESASDEEEMCEADMYVMARDRNGALDLGPYTEALRQGFDPSLVTACIRPAMNDDPTCGPLMKTLGEKAPAGFYLYDPTSRELSVAVTLLDPNHLMRAEDAKCGKTRQERFTSESCDRRAYSFVDGLVENTTKNVESFDVFRRESFLDHSDEVTRCEGYGGLRVRVSQGALAGKDMYHHSILSFLAYGTHTNMVILNVFTRVPDEKNVFDVLEHIADVLHVAMNEVDLSTRTYVPGNE